MARITQPTLVAVGTKDDIGGSAEALAGLMPNAAAFAIEGRDHMLAVGDRTFKAHAVEFLRAHPVQAPIERRAPGKLRGVLGLILSSAAVVVAVELIWLGLTALAAFARATPAAKASFRQGLKIQHSIPLDRTIRKIDVQSRPRLAY